MNKLMVFFLFGLSACAGHSKVEQQVAHEVRSEPSIETSLQLKEKLLELIQQDTDLNEANRTHLSAVVNKMTDANQEISTEIFGLKTVLMKEVLSEQYSHKKVSLIEKKIAELFKKQFHNSVQALEEMKTVMGKRLNQISPTLQRMIDFGGGRR